MNNHVLEFHQLELKLENYNKIAMVILGILGFWWIFMEMISELLVQRTFMLGIAGIFLLSLYVFVTIFGNSISSKALSIYRFICLFGTIFWINKSPLVFTFTLMGLTIIVLFQQSVNILRGRINRTKGMVSTYKHDKSAYTTLELNIEYINERIRWLISTHTLLLLLSTIFLVFVNIFISVESTVDNRIIQSTGIISLLLVIIVFISKFYIKEEQE
ncbi:MAG: hypothetical protein INQ03_01125 [Candidatus Heimdallarchaeota archaeon]|nr:hypothetical protein [Candidatus Heimdallarchaeota archaeon]